MVFFFVPLKIYFHVIWSQFWLHDYMKLRKTLSKFVFHWLESWCKIGILLEFSKQPCITGLVSYILFLLSLTSWVGLRLGYSLTYKLQTYNLRATASVLLKDFIYFTKKPYFFYFTPSLLQNTHISPSIIHYILYKWYFYILFLILFYLPILFFILPLLSSSSFLFLISLFRFLFLFLPLLSSSFSHDQINTPSQAPQQIGRASCRERV